LREICPPKKKTPKSGANIGAIAGELLTHFLITRVSIYKIFSYVR
jgi:hypothetical protein